MNNAYRQRVAYVNIGLIAVNVLYFVFLEVAGSTESTGFMVARGAMYTPLVLEKGEYYRLVTSIFMHFGVSHIMNNMLVLYVIGDKLEHVLGHIKYLIFYLLCGVGANIASMLVNLSSYGTSVSAGASGAIFGVIGGLLYAVAVNKGHLEDISTRQLLIMTGFSLYLGFTSQGIDNTAHIAGLILGILLGALFYRKPKKQRDVAAY